MKKEPDINNSGEKPEEAELAELSGSSENPPEAEQANSAADGSAAVEKPGLRRAAVIALIVAAAAVVAALSFCVYAHTAGNSAKAENRAEAFAESLTETLQSKGQARVEEQFWNGYAYRNSGKSSKKTVYDGLLFDIVDAYDKFGPSDSSYEIYGRKDGAVLPGNGDSQYYTILGAGHKDEKYDVQISYDPSAYGDDAEEDSRAYNVNSFPDADALSSGKTAVINPEGMYVEYETDSDGSYIYDDTSCSFKSKNKTMETAALDAFFEKYTNFYQQAVNLVNTAFENAGVDSSHRLSGSSFYSTSQKESKEAAMKPSITRDTVILADGDDGNISVRASVLYELSDASLLGDPQSVISAIPTALAGATIETEVEQDTDSSYDLNGDGIPDQTASQPQDSTVQDQTQQEQQNTESGGVSTVTVYEPITQEQIDTLSSTLGAQITALWNAMTTDSALTVQYPVYESDSAFDSLENIYVMYCPLRKGEWKNDYINVDISGIRSQYSAKDKLNLYVVPQLGLLSTADTSYNTLQGSDYMSPKLSGGKVTYGGTADIPASAITDDTESDLTADDGSGTAAVENEGTLFDMTRIRVGYLKGWLRNIAAADMNDSVVAKSGSQDIVYQLTVKVYKASGGKFSDGSLLAERTETCS